MQYQHQKGNLVKIQLCKVGIEDIKFYSYFWVMCFCLYFWLGHFATRVRKVAVGCSFLQAWVEGSGGSKTTLGNQNWTVVLDLGLAKLWPFNRIYIIQHPSLGTILVVELSMAKGKALAEFMRWKHLLTSLWCPYDQVKLTMYMLNNFEAFTMNSNYSLVN